jgi:hypothetical protein
VEDNIMKTAVAVATTLLGLLLSAVPASAKDPNPANYTLSAQVMGYERPEVRGESSVTDAHTGAISGWVDGGVTPGHVEIKVGNVIYTTVGRWRKVTNDVGSSFPAYIDGRHINLLVPDKDGKLQNMAFRIKGQRVAQPSS